LGHDRAEQALERVRATGRLAAHLATQQAQTVIGADDFTRAASAVERVSATPNCPQAPPDFPAPVTEPITSDPAETILAQWCIAFGQGTGVLRVSTEAIRAMREHYLGGLSPALIRGWQTDAVQVLERIRAEGRLAAQFGVARAQGVIGAEEFLQAARTIEPVPASAHWPSAHPSTGGQLTEEAELAHATS
jgi:hypothetical protein